MRKLLLVVAFLAGHLSLIAQTTNLPANLGTFEVFRNANLPVTIIMPSGYPIVTPKVELWNNGVKLSDSTTIIVSGDTIKFTLTKAQIQPLVKSSYFFITFANAYLMGAAINPKIGVGIPSNSARVISLPPSGNIRVTMAGDASTAIQASAAASASATTAIQARDSANAILASSGAQLQSRMKFGTMAQLRATAETISAFTVVEGVRSGLFRYDPSDTTSPDDTAMVIRQGTKRFVRVSQNVSPLFFGAVGDSITDDAVALRKAALAANLRKRALYIDPGYVFTINSTVNFNCNVEGFGTIKTRNSSSFTAGIGNITVKDITITGKHNNVIEGRGLYLTFSASISVENVKVFNTVSQGIYFSGVLYAKATNCRTTTNRGEYGDGIYFTNCLNATATNNITRDFQRIGIVFEGGCTYIIATGNQCKDSFPAFVTQFNGGIWGERIKGGVFSNNHIENVRDKALTLTPNTVVTLGKTYAFIVTGNIIVKCAEGFGFAASEDQVLTYSDNMNIDVARPIEIGKCLDVSISNSTFAAKDSSGSYFVELIRFVPTLAVGKKSKVTISNCKNYINSTTFAAIMVPNATGNKLDLHVTDCRTGNWSYYFYASQMTGEIRFTNTNIDFTHMTSGTWYLANSTSAIFDNCDIKLPSITLTSQGTDLVFRNTRVNADALARILLFSAGSQNIRIERSKMNNVHFYDVRRADTKIYLIDSEFDNYQTTGLFQLVSVAVNTLEARGNRFSESQTSVVPLQMPLGVTTPIIGENFFFNTGGLYSGFVATRQGVMFTRSTTGSRPTVTQIGFNHFDTSLNKFIYWDGTDWVVPPLYTSNASTTAPTKSGLNTLYGAYGAGTRIYYTLITGGGRDYIKISNSSTSDWNEYVYSTGVTTTLP